MKPEHSRILDSLREIAKGAEFETRPESFDPWSNPSDQSFEHALKCLAIGYGIRLRKKPLSPVHGESQNSKHQTHLIIMSLKLGDAPKAQGVQAPAGNHLAIAYAVVDCGTHTEDGQYGIKTNRKIKVSWELPEETHTFKEDRGPEPFSVHKQYNFTVGEKATLRKDLEGWRGKPFTSEELENFELESIVGKPCMLNVVHTVKGDRTYANIQSITPVPKSLKGSVPPLHNKPVYYDISMGREDSRYKNLPDFMREYIAKCNEWNGGTKSGGHPSNGLAADGSILEDDGSDVPF